MGSGVPSALPVVSVFAVRPGGRRPHAIAERHAYGIVIAREAQDLLEALAEALH